MPILNIPSELFRRLQCQNEIEIAAAFFMNKNASIIHTHSIEGSANMLDLPIHQLVQDSISLNAWRLLIVHTHPSGDPHPSINDITATRHLCGLLRRQQQKLIDHIILAKDHYFSFRQNHLL